MNHYNNAPHLSVWMPTLIIKINASKAFEGSLGVYHMCFPKFVSERLRIVDELKTKFLIFESAAQPRFQKLNFGFY
jgi:hypothetical protein